MIFHVCLAIVFLFLLIRQQFSDLAHFLSLSDPAELAKKVMTSSKEEVTEILKKFYVSQDDNLSFLFVSNPRLDATPIKGLFMIQ